MTASTIAVDSSLVPEAGDEGAVDLQDVDPEAEQVQQRRVAGAEVVDRDAHAERLDVAQLGTRRLGLVDERALGELEAERGRLEPVALQRGLDHGRELRPRELAPGHVDPRRPECSGRVESCHAPTCAHDRVEHPLADRHDELGALGDRDELRRRHRARAPGCRQRMSASTPTMRDVVEVVHRLVLEEQLVVLDRVAQRLFGLDAAHGPVQTSLSNIETRSPPFDFASYIAASASCSTASASMPSTSRRGAIVEADARGHDELAAVDVERPAQVVRRSCAAMSTAASASATSCSTTTNSSPPSRATVSTARRPVPNRPRDLDEQLVAGRVPERVVHRLEPVEIDEQHRGAETVAARAGERLAQAVDHQRAVRQAGERVVQRTVFECLFGRRGAP